MKNQTTGTIRHSTDDDKPKIHEIAVAAWTPIFDRYRLIAGDEMWNDVWRGWEKTWLTNASGIVTELDGEIVGFATWSSPLEGILGEIGANAVQPKLQGHGIGTAQMNWVVEQFRERGYKCLKVHTGMDPAHGPARAEYRKIRMGRGVKNSRYYNYLSEVASIPIRPSLNFRWAESDDVELIHQMCRSAWRSVYESIRDTVGNEMFEIVFKDALEQRVDAFAKRAADAPRKVRIVMEDSRPAGFAFLGATHRQKLGKIFALGVLPEFRGRGIGCAMCVDAFNTFRKKDLRYVILEATLGEVNEQTHQMCWNAGLYREIPSIDYYMML